MTIKIERDFFQWRQDTPQMQFKSLKGSIEMHLENIDQGLGDAIKQMRVVVALIASLNALTPYYTADPNQWPREDDTEPATPRSLK